MDNKTSDEDKRIQNEIRNYEFRNMNKQQTADRGMMGVMEHVGGENDYSLVLQSVTVFMCV